MRPLVILRPEPGASATASEAERIGLTPILIPLFRIEAVEWTAPDPQEFDALLMTSANAVRQAGPELGRLATLPAYCVGEATAAAASNAGLVVDRIGSGGIDALLGSILEGRKLLHLCGVDRRTPKTGRHSICALPVYESVALPMPDGLRRLQSAIIAVHSPRAAGRLRDFVEQGEITPGAFAVAAISSEAAKAAGPGWASVEIAAEPTDAALLAIAARLCNNRD